MAIDYWIRTSPKKGYQLSYVSLSLPSTQFCETKTFWQTRCLFGVSCFALKTAYNQKDVTERRELPNKKLF